MRCDEETPPDGCEGADIKHTVSFRVWTDGCGTQGQLGELGRNFKTATPPLTTITWR
jgi:hypothetical protein